MTYDLAVVGAGIVGLAHALAAARRDRRAQLSVAVRGNATVEPEDGNTVIASVRDVHGAIVHGNTIWRAQLPLLAALPPESAHEAQ